jgi:hypothetical protein
MLKWFVIGIVATFCFFLSFLILYHQKLTFGTWFQISQVLHHETFAIAFSVLGIGIPARIAMRWRGGEEGRGRS